MGNLSQAGFGGPAAARAQGGQGTSTSVAASGVRDVDALLSGYKWGATALTYALPSGGAQYTSYDPAIDENGTFAPVTGALAAVVRSAMGHFSAVSGLNLTETSSTATATLLIGRTEQTAAGHAYLPDGSPVGGDVWLSASPDYDSPVKGSHAWLTVIHEVGHALGLKHAHTFIGGQGAFEDDVGVISQPVSSERDNLEYTVMTYRGYAGQDIAANDGFINEEFGYPQSLMMLDIAALQQMYGADFNTNAGDTLYRFSPTTGEMSVNGAGQGAPGANRLFLTVWDGGGADTFDFSQYATGVKVDLAPGAYSLASTAQRADLGDGQFAAGNVYNALQYRGDARSLIENAVGGTGADVMRGNAASNTLTGNAGADTLLGDIGGDRLLGGAEADHLIGDGAVTWTAEAASVHRLYLATLDRAPDAGGHQSWIDQLAGGQTLANVAAGFVGSAEFQNTYGSLSNTQFVTLLYNNVLNRAPDAGGLAAGVSALDTNAQTRTQIVLGFSESAEFRAATSPELHAGQIYRLYGATLARTPDAGGFETWTDALGSGRGLTDVAAGFVGSAEFQTKYGGQDDAGFVTLLYNNVLGRAPDAGGLSYWTGQIGSNAQSRTQVVTGFSESAEYVNGTRAATDAFMRSIMTAWSDTLAGGAGNDALTGGNGADRYVFAATDGGNDTVYGFESFDTLELSDFGFASSAQAIAAITQQGANAVLTYTGGSITFADTQVSVLQGMTAQGWVLG